MRKRLVGLATLVAALCLIIPGLVLASPSNTSTTADWDGTSEIAPFGGSGDTPTYGQTFTGAGANITAFTFYINTHGVDINAQGGIGVWDGTKVTSIVWMGPTQTMHTNALSPVTFTPNVALADGVHYVIFATVLFSDNGNGSSTWGILTDNASYGGGSFVYTNGYDQNTALATDWDGIDRENDLAFIFSFGAASVEQVDRSGYCTVAGNTNPSSGAAFAVGTFLDLAAGQPETDSLYTGATNVFYYEGLGISCDKLPGYTMSGELVGYGGHGDAGRYVYMARNKA